MTFTATSTRAAAVTALSLALIGGIAPRDADAAGMIVTVTGSYAVSVDDNGGPPITLAPGRYAALNNGGRRARTPWGYCTKVSGESSSTCNYRNHAADQWNEFGYWPTATVKRWWVGRL
ncbi:hypothetical protein GCM10009616_35590 [Microlunatus lacustris]